MQTRGGGRNTKNMADVIQVYRPQVSNRLERNSHLRSPVVRMQRAPSISLYLPEQRPSGLSPLARSIWYHFGCRPESNDVRAGGGGGESSWYEMDIFEGILTIL